MKKATLIYEPALQGYALKFDYDKDVLDFFKKIVPAGKRTVSTQTVGMFRNRRTGKDEPKVEWTWYFGEEYFDIVKHLFEAHRSFDLKIISREDVENLRKSQEEYRQNYVTTTQSYSIDDELRKFHSLVVSNGTSLDEVKNLTRDEALRYYRKAAFTYHPDRNRGDIVAEEKMTELNRTWSLLKEVYFTK